MRKFIDIETNETITEKQLFDEFIMMKEKQPLEYWYSFSEYVNNCMTKNNGTLEEIK